MFAANEGVTPNDKLYVDDVFSTYLYTGNGSTQNITNGIDLAGEGGLVWEKPRSIANDHYLTTGFGNFLRSNTTGAQSNTGSSTYTFNSTGYVANSWITGLTVASWTFRKQPKFFDVVTYTGNGVAGRQIAHSLGVAPGMIIVKRTDTTGYDWAVYHRSTAETKVLYLNNTNAEQINGIWNNTVPTSTNFSVAGSTFGSVNASGGTYVAYLFAHDAGGFGLTGTDNVISCGSYTGNGSPPLNVTLGWEPQFVIIKNASATANWAMYDVMRGMPTGNFTAVSALLQPNLSNAENLGANRINPTATGFTINEADAQNNVNGNTYIYIAIRRPNKPPTTGTQVYNAITRNGNSSAGSRTGVGFPPDFWMAGARATSGAADQLVTDRLRGPLKSLGTTSTAAEGTAQPTSFDQDGVTYTASSLGNSSGVAYIDWFFRRAPGFFDVVCYTGTGVARTVTHNLGVVPELMIFKKRTGTPGQWTVYAGDATKALRLNTSDAAYTSSAEWNNTAPTSSVFTLGAGGEPNDNTYQHVAYLFATCPGVSKVGSYTGTGSTLQIDCGFTGGARFVLIKRTDSTGDWYVWDSARGIVAANDPHLSLNTTAPEVTTNDSVDPDSSGFIVNQNTATNINVSGASYIFLAIA